MAHRVVLDTDPGIDDSLAILLALASPEIELAGVSVTGGNCPLDNGVHNALNVVALAGQPELPVYSGVALPLLRAPLTAPETHGDAGLGHAHLPTSEVPPADEHGVDMIIREITAHPGEITLVAVAPLTNVALAIRKEPRIVEAVRHVIIMGGALRVDGNTTPLAEFNFYVDPHAASIVLHSGMPITLLPWDITKDILLTQEAIDQLLQISSPVSTFIADAARFYIDFHLTHFGFAGCSINDPAALALVFRPDLATITPLFVDIETTSEVTMGKTIGDFRNESGHPHNVQLVTAFDSESFLQIFVSRMEMLADRTRTA